MRDLEAVAKRFALALLAPGQVAAMSTAKLLATLNSMVAVEKFYLSRSMDPRPIQEAQPLTETGFRIVHRRWPPGVDPSAHLYDENGERVIRQSPEDPSPPAGLPQPPPGFASGGMEEERSIRAPRPPTKI
jgi:hypothetical protein